MAHPPLDELRWLHSSCLATMASGEVAKVVGDQIINSTGDDDFEKHRIVRIRSEAFNGFDMLGRERVPPRFRRRLLKLTGDTHGLGTARLTQGLFEVLLVGGAEDAEELAVAGRY